MITASDFVTPNDVAAGGTGFVVVGSSAGFPGDGRIWFSTDGASWEALPADPWRGVPLSHVLLWRDMFVAAGVAGEGTEGRIALWTSSDGRDWTRIADRPEFVVYREADSRRFGPAKCITNAVILDMWLDGDKLFVEGYPLVDKGCLGGGDDPGVSVIFRSADGSRWQRSIGARRIPNPDEEWAAIPANGGWLRIGCDDCLETGGHVLIEASSDGDTWYVVWRDEIGGAGLSELAPYSGGYLAVGTRWGDRAHLPRGLAITSADGQTWIESTGWPDMEDGYLRGFGELNGRIVAIGGRSDAPAPWQGGRLPYVWVSPPLDP